MDIDQSHSQFQFELEGLQRLLVLSDPEFENNLFTNTPSNSPSTISTNPISTSTLPQSNQHIPKSQQNGHNPNLHPDPTYKYPNPVPKCHPNPNLSQNHLHPVGNVV